MQNQTTHTKQCKTCWISFEVTNEDLKFLQKISPEIDWEIFEILSTNECVECAKQRRLIRRNERKLYKRKCDFSWKTIISNISPEKPYKVYSQDIRLSDKRDPLDYWFDFESKSSFFSQLNKLIVSVPMGILNYTSENSDYVSYGTNNKNCYLCYCASYNKDCYYCRFVQKSEDCVDCLFIVESRNCYECVEVNNGFNLKYVYKSDDCSNSTLLANCNWCSDCFACRNLTNQKYCIFNKKYSKQEYNLFISKLTQTNFKKYQQKFLEKTKSMIVKNLDIINCDNCTWDHLNNNKNCINCFNGLSAENCKNCNDFGYGEYMHNLSYAWYEVKYAYELLAAEQVYKSAFCISCINIKHCYYTMMSTNCEFCFGCIGLKDKQYCIFNKQYSKQEYNIMLKKIINHMIKSSERWEFFPKEINPFWYNETLAQEYYPLSQKEVLNKWFKRMNKEYPIDIPVGIETIKSKNISDDIDQIDDSILTKAIICEITNKPYRVVKPELEFYRKHKLPIPKIHPDLRHQYREVKRNPQILFDRKCDKCWIQLKTTYSLDRTERVCCKNCYSKEIY